MRRLGTWLFAVVLCSSFAHAAQNKPNVLFIVADDLNNSLACYGALVKTPNLDKLAARGVRFDRAYCQYPLCGPSRASLMSGMRPDKIGVLTNGPTVRAVRSDVVTLPQLFRSNGYFAARVGKIYHLGIPGGVGTPGPDDPQSWDHTFDPSGAEFKTPGEEHNPDPQRGQGFRRVLGDGEGVEQADYQSADEAIRLLRQQKTAGKPFFLAVGFIRPHVPDIAPRKYFEMHALEKIALPKVPAGDRDDIPLAAFMDPKPNWNMSDADCRESIRAYYACVSFMDAQAGRVLDELEKLALADNTIVTFVGDHGYALGEHATWQKMMLFEPVARVPYIIAAPGVKASSTQSLAEMIDLYPTIAQLANVTPPKEIDGVSLVPVLNDPAAKVKEAAYTQVRRKGANGRTVRTERWRYTEWGDAGADGVELYDEQNDPGELTNLAKDPAHAQRVEELKTRLRRNVQ
jgi:uncharacterized sulfatase